MAPYRCEDCAHRFIGPEPRHLSIGRLTVAASIVIVVGFALAMLLLTPEAAEHDDELMLAAEVSPISGETLEAAEAGDPDAAYRVGKSLLLDATVDKRKGAEALEWFTRAANSGHSGAMIQLGRMYRTGIGALQNFSGAADWIRKAAEQGDADGMLELGRLYRDGVGMDQDYVKAYIWFNRAAALLNMEAAREREVVARKLNAEQLSAAQLISTHNGVDELPQASQEE